jgi:hypothetical protein
MLDTVDQYLEELEAPELYFKEEVEVYAFVPGEFGLLQVGVLEAESEVPLRPLEVQIVNFKETLVIPYQVRNTNGTWGPTVFIDVASLTHDLFLCVEGWRNLYREKQNMRAHGAILAAHAILLAYALKHVPTPCFH